MPEKDEPIKDLEALNKKYYNLFNELKHARPSLQNCDSAFLSMVQKLTEQYEAESKSLNKEGEVTKTSERVDRIKDLNEHFYFLGKRLAENAENLSAELTSFMGKALLLEYQKQYDLITGEYDVEMDRESDKRQALYDRLVPNRELERRFLLFFKKKTQNRAADLVDFEADEKVKKFFAEEEARLAELVAERLYAEGLAKEFKEKLKAYAEGQLAENGEQEGDDSEQGAEDAQNDVQGDVAEKIEPQPIVNVYVASLVSPDVTPLEEKELKQLEEGEETSEDPQAADGAEEDADASDRADETTEDEQNRDVVIEVEGFDEDYDTEYDPGDDDSEQEDAENVEETSEDAQDADDVEGDAGAPESVEEPSDGAQEGVIEEEGKDDSKNNRNQ